MNTEIVHSRNTAVTRSGNEASLSITPVSAEASFGAGKSGDVVTASSISLAGVLSPDVRVYFANGRSASDLTWRVHITDATSYNPWASERGAIGTIFTSAASGGSEDSAVPECFVGAAVGQESFNTLMGFLQRGLLPRSVHIQAQGLPFGHAGAGVSYVWDVGSLSTLPVLAVTFSIALARALQ